MAQYGRFETVDELASAGPFAVFSAREVGSSGPPAYAIKVYRTANTMADAEVVERQSSAFLEAAGVQKALPPGPAAGGSGHWAPVHEMGQGSDGVFYVTDLYPSSVQRLVDGRRELEVRAVASLIEGVVAGLEELEATGRGHGRLTPSNVLLGRGDVEDAQVALTDPEAGSRLDRNAPAQDRRALAGVLYQVVLHRAPPRGGSVTTSPEWQRMGQGGELLRQLCEALLNPQADAPPMPFAQVRERLKGVLASKAPSKGGMPLGAKLGIAAVLVIGLGVGGYVVFGPKPGPPADPRGAAPMEWMAAGLTQLDQQLADAEEKAAKNLDSGHTAEFVGLKTQLAAFDEEVQRVRDIAVPLTQTEVDPLKIKTDAIEAKRADFAKDIARIAGSITKLDPSKDPRVAAEGKEWGADTVAEVEALLQRARDDFPEETRAAAIAEAEGKVRTYAQEVESVRAMKWEDASAEAKPANEEIFRRVQALAQAKPKVRNDATAAARNARAALVAYADRRRNEQITSDSLRGAFFEVTQGIRPEKDEKMHFADLKARFDEATAWVDAMSRAFTVPEDLKPTAIPGLDTEAAARAIENHREAFLAPLAASAKSTGRLPAAGAAEVETQQREFRAYAAEVRKVMQDAARATSLLAQGYAYNEPDGDVSIESLRGWMTGSRVYPDVKAAVEPVVASADVLLGVSSQSNVPALVALVAQADATPRDLSPARAAWDRLVEQGYPADAVQLTEAATLHSQHLRPALAALPAGARRDRIDAATRGGLRQMWTNFVYAKANGNPAAVDAAFASRADLNVDDAYIATLEPWTRFNFERWKLLNTARAMKEPDRNRQVDLVKALVGGFLRDVAGINTGGRADVAAIEKQLKPFAEGKYLDLTQEGPGRTKTGWVCTKADQDGAFAVYEWEKGGQRLVFQRVAANNETASYLCTTEVSVGLFIKLVEAAPDGWAILRGGTVAGRTVTGITAMTPPNNDGRRGPRTISWVDGKIEVSHPSGPPDKTGNGWHRAVNLEEMATTPYYPDGPKAPPDVKHPIDFVSPGACAYVAKLAGCRLPKDSEWLAARGMPQDGKINLRDESYVRQYNYIGTIFNRMGKQVDYPATRMYVPTRAEQEKRKLSIAAAENDAQPAVESDDHVLFFAHVDDDASPGDMVFHHLLGNVWEYVVKDGTALDAVPDSFTPKMMKDAVKTSEVGVIGGSALSPQALPTAELLPLPTIIDEGCSDVGFRLAFSTGAGGSGVGLPAENLVKVLSGPYLAQAPAPR